jgi:hypothetical protein
MGHKITFPTNNQLKTSTKSVGVVYINNEGDTADHNVTAYNWTRNGVTGKSWEGFQLFQQRMIHGKPEYIACEVTQEGLVRAVVSPMRFDDREQYIDKQDRYTAITLQELDLLYVKQMEYEIGRLGRRLAIAEGGDEIVRLFEAAGEPSEDETTL